MKEAKEVKERRKKGAKERWNEANEANGAEERSKRYRGWGKWFDAIKPKPEVIRCDCLHRGVVRRRSRGSRRGSAALHATCLSRSATRRTPLRVDGGLCVADGRCAVLRTPLHVGGGLCNAAWCAV